MFNFLKKLFGAKQSPQDWPFPTSKTAPTMSPQAPYKVEPAVEVTTKIDGIGHESIAAEPEVTSKLDVNKDGKVNLEDVNAIVQQVSKKIVKTVKEKADVNKDGKVNAADAKAVVKKVVDKAKTVSKKTAPKKTAPKK